MSSRSDGAAEVGGVGSRDFVIRDVIRGLYEGRFEPGQRLVERQLTKRYGISRGPVREALNRLAAIGVIELTPQRGARIRLLSLREAIDSLIVVQSLVSTAAKLAAERCKARGATDRLNAAVADLAGFDHSSTSAQYARARDAFYAALTAMAKNAALSRALPSIDIHLVRVQFRYAMRPVDRLRHRDYQEIAKAVTSGNAKEAARAAFRHIGRTITVLTELGQDQDRDPSDEEPNWLDTEL